MSKKKEPPAITPEDIVPKSKASRTPIEVAAHQLRPAPWNPRAEITPESVADLAASIRELGLIQRIVVIRDPDKKPVDGVEFYLIVAGHRRFAAWNAAGIGGLIPCELLDCDIETAKRMTLIENLQRKDVDPIMEADLIAGLVESGMTEAEIAAETGRGEKWVWRRKQLQMLTDSWKGMIGHGFEFTVDCLERIAAYSAEVQDEAQRRFTVHYAEWDGIVNWRHIDHYFDQLSRDLRNANFPKNQCTHCQNNSANAPMLFDLEENSKGKPVKWGTCLCAKCFERKSEEMVAVAIESARGTGHEVVEAKHESEVPRSWDVKKAPDKEHPVLYVWTDYSGKRRCGYGEAKAATDVKAADKAKRAKERAERKLINETCDAIGEWVNTFAKDAVRDALMDACGISVRYDALLFELMYIFGLGGYCDEREPFLRYSILRWRDRLIQENRPQPLKFEEVWERYFANSITDPDLTAAAHWYQIFSEQIDAKVQLTDEQRELLKRHFIPMEDPKESEVAE